MGQRPQKQGTRTIDRDQLERIIGKAAELKLADADEGERKMTLAEAKDVGREVGLDGDLVERSVRAVEDEKQAAAAAEVARGINAQVRAATRNKRLMVAGAFVGCMGLLVAWDAGFVSRLHGTVLRARSQVANVVSRQQAVRARVAPAIQKARTAQADWDRLASGPRGEYAREANRALDALEAAVTAGNDANAELAGAESRVGIEKRRYDEAATAYNQNAGGWLGPLARRVNGLPPSVPLSSEVAW